MRYPIVFLVLLICLALLIALPVWGNTRRLLAIGENTQQILVGGLAPAPPPPPPSNSCVLPAQLPCEMT